MKERGISRKDRPADGIRVPEPAPLSCRFGISYAGVTFACRREQRMGGLPGSESATSLEKGFSYTSKRVALLDRC